MRRLIGTVAALMAAWPALADDADVLSAEATAESAGTWRFAVTVSHPDGGWDHYADAWEVVAPDGRVLGTRVLAHPHVNEQPFTRSLGGIAVPADLREVVIRAHCSVDGDGGRFITLTWPGYTGILQAMAPGVIWVSALLAVLLSLDRLFKQDYDDGSLDQLMLSPNPLMILVLSKVTAHWLLTGLPLVIIAPLLGLFMSLPMDAVTVLIYSLLLGTPVLSLVGAIGVSLTVAVNRGGVLLSLIILPLYIPILIFGANAVDVATDGLPVTGQLLFLGAVLALAASLAPLATSVALRITASR